MQPGIPQYFQGGNLESVAFVIQLIRRRNLDMSIFHFRLWT